MLFVCFFFSGIVEQAKYEAKLHMEKDATLRLKGENGIMKKKFNSLKKDIDEQKDEIKAMIEKEAQLYKHIEALEREYLSASCVVIMAWL